MRISSFYLVFLGFFTHSFFGRGQDRPPTVETETIHRTADITLRDPFVYADSSTQTYYLYRSGNQPGGAGKVVEVFAGSDLNAWKGPYTVFTLPNDFWAKEAIWAPEVHPYQGKYYLFVTFTSKQTLPDSAGRTLNRRGTQVLVADSPRGPFKPFANQAHTPADWMALDGTFYVEDSHPWLVFCHEWIQLGNGTLEAVRLNDDLSATQGKPFTLFRATDAPWVRKYTWNVHSGYVTDGPFFYKTKQGTLLLIWSSYEVGNYAVGVAVSQSGKLAGPWKQETTPLFRSDGGHGMLFRTFAGQLMLALHQPNSPPEKLRLIPLHELDERLRLQP